MDRGQDKHEYTELEIEHGMPERDQRRDEEGMVDPEDDVIRNLRMMRKLSGDPRARATVDGALATIRALRSEVADERARKEGWKESFGEMRRRLDTAEAALSQKDVALRWIARAPEAVSAWHLRERAARALNSPHPTPPNHDSAVPNHEPTTKEAPDA